MRSSNKFDGPTWFAVIVLLIATIIQSVMQADFQNQTQASMNTLRKEIAIARRDQVLSESAALSLMLEGGKDSLLAAHYELMKDYDRMNVIGEVYTLVMTSDSTWRIVQVRLE